MSNGVFSSLSQSYFQAGKNVFYFVGNSSWFMKPFTFILALGFNIILFPVGMIFAVFIILDHLGGFTDNLRKGIMNSMDRHSWSVDDSFFSFLFRPIMVVLISPLFIISLMIPKISSDALTHVAEEELKGIISGAGAFKRLNDIIWNTINRLFVYVGNSPLLIKPIALVIALGYALVLGLLGVFFILLIPLDWISQLVESIRQGIVRFVDTKQDRIRYNTGAFLFTPILLVLLAPVFLIAILIPKFSSCMSEV